MVHPKSRRGSCSTSARSASAEAGPVGAWVGRGGGGATCVAQITLSPKASGRAHAGPARAWRRQKQMLAAQAPNALLHPKACCPPASASSSTPRCAPAEEPRWMRSAMPSRYIICCITAARVGYCRQQAAGRQDSAGGEGWLGGVWGGDGGPASVRTAPQLPSSSRGWWVEVRRCCGSLHPAQPHRALPSPACAARCGRCRCGTSAPPASPCGPARRERRGVKGAKGWMVGVVGWGGGGGGGS